MASTVKKMPIAYFCKVMNQYFCGRNVPGNLAKIFLKVINVYYQEPSADTIDFGPQDENYKFMFFASYTFISSNDEH